MQGTCIIYYSTIVRKINLIWLKERAKYNTLLHCNTGQKYGWKAEQENWQTKQPKLSVDILLTARNLQNIHA